MQLIQQSNKEAIDKGEMPYDSVHVKNDTLFYYRNNEFQMKTFKAKINSRESPKHHTRK